LYILVFLTILFFEEQPEFYASYKLINVKSYQKYNDSLTLHVVDLSHIELATEEDKLLEEQNAQIQKLLTELEYLRGKS